MEIVCACVVTPLSLLLDVAAFSPGAMSAPRGGGGAPSGESDATLAAGGPSEAEAVRAIRGPFALLLYTLSWHEDNLASLFAAHQSVIARAALHWLRPFADEKSERKSGDDLVRRNLATVIWNFAKKKERALALTAPDMLHPLLARLAEDEETRDVRFAVAGALEYLVSHRSSLSPRRIARSAAIFSG